MTTSLAVSCDGVRILASLGTWPSTALGLRPCVHQRPLITAAMLSVKIVTVTMTTSYDRRPCCCHNHHFQQQTQHGHRAHHSILLLGRRYRAERWRLILLVSSHRQASFKPSWHQRGSAPKRSSHAFCKTASVQCSGQLLRPRRTI